MNIIKKILSLFLIFFIILNPIESKAEEISSPKQQTVLAITKQATKLYKKANPSNGSYGIIPANKKIVCTKVSGVWARVEAAGYTGYVYKSILKPAETSTNTKPTSHKIICYIKENTNLYSSKEILETNIIISLTKGDKVLVSQVKNGWATLYTTSGILGYLPSEFLSKTKINSEKQILLKDWYTSDISDIYDIGTYATIIDVATGKSFEVKRSGGYNHADTEPVDKKDTKILKEIYEGTFSWDRKAIWVVINNVYYPASMNGMPHGNQTINSNNYEGHFCVHFLNSKTHDTNKKCPLHQACIKQAYINKP